MGKHKHSFVRLEDENPSCIWALFRVLNNHRWHTFKKLITNKKTRKDKQKVKKRCKINVPDELHNINSAHVIWGIFGYGLFSKKSNKTSIITEESSVIEEDNRVLESNNNAPTLLSLLKAHPYPKMMINKVDNNRDFVVSNQDDKTSVGRNSKEDNKVGVFELFQVNQDMFLEMLQDSRLKKPRLVKSGTFPSPNRSSNMVFRRMTSKVEYKFNEVWRVSNNKGGELKRTKSSQGGFGRAYSFNEKDIKFEGNNGKEIKKNLCKNLSKSLRLRNEKDFMLLSDKQGRRSFKEMGFLWEIDRDNLDGVCHIDESVDELDEEMLSPVSALDAFVEEDDTNENVVCSIPKDSICVSNTISVKENVEEDINPSIDLSTNFDKGQDYYNEDLHYVRYVLDVIGFSLGEDPQPLDPAIFDAIEICCPFESSNKEVDIDIDTYTLQRKMLFDLVNESLTSITEKSHKYYPRALSSSCHVRTMSKGKNRVVDELLEYISESLSWRPELDETLELAVAHEISDNRFGWMNLQRDSESIALDLADLIVNELLDEIVYG